MVKDNQPSLCDALRVFFEEPLMKTRKAREEKRHGSRHERRLLRASSEMNEYMDWPGLGQVIEITRWCQEGRQEPSRETRYAITSLREDEAEPKRLLELIRGHWGIENKLHYVRDVTLAETSCVLNAPRCAYAFVSDFSTFRGPTSCRSPRNEPSLTVLVDHSSSSRKRKTLAVGDPDPWHGHRLHNDEAGLGIFEGRTRRRSRASQGDDRCELRDSAVASTKIAAGSPGEPKPPVEIHGPPLPFPSVTAELVDPSWAGDGSPVAPGLAPSGSGRGASACVPFRRHSLGCSSEDRGIQ